MGGTDLGKNQSDTGLETTKTGKSTRLELSNRLETVQISRSKRQAFYGIFFRKKQDGTWMKKWKMKLKFGKKNALWYSEFRENFATADVFQVMLRAS